MGTLTRAELRAEVDANLGGRTLNLPSTDQAALETRINRQLHLAQIRIAREHDFSSMLRSDTDTVPATATYTNLPTGLKEIYSLVRQEASLSQSVKLTWVPQRQWDQLIGSASSLPTGETTHYTLWGTAANPDGVIEWFRVPSSSFTLQRRYSLWPADFADDSKTSQLEDVDDIIIAAATERLFQSLGEMQEAVVWNAIYRDLIDKAIKEDIHKPDKSLLPRGARDGAAMAYDPVRDPFVNSISSD